MLKVDDLKSTKMSPWGKYMPVGTKKFGDSNVYGLKSGMGGSQGMGGRALSETHFGQMCFLH